MKSSKYYIVFCTIIISVIIIDCIHPTAGVETTNGATVVMRDDRVEGTSPPFASVYLFDTSYIPYIDTGLGVATVSDEAGVFSMKQIGVKNIHVQVFDNRKQHTVLFTVGADGELQKATLKLPGALSGSVTVSGAGKVLVFICGTGYYVLLDASGVWSFKDLPPGTYKIQAILLGTTSGEKPAIIASSEKLKVNVVSGEETRMVEKLVIP